MAYSPKDVLENKNVFYEVCMDWMTLDGGTKEDAEDLAEWLRITLHSLKCRWKRVFGYSLNDILNYKVD